MTDYIVDPGLKTFATPRQIEYIDAANELGSLRAVGRKFGLSDDRVAASIRGLRKRAANEGYAPESGLDHPIAIGQRLKGYSNYYNKEGNLAGQWVKTRIDDAQWVEDVKDGVRAFVNDQPLIIPAAAPQADYDTDVIPWFQIGDAHLGMLAHEAETGANFDLKIAESEICSAMAILIDEAPVTERCVLQDCGDMTHYENMAGVTEASGNPLDYDGRFPKMISVYSRVMRFMIERALTKYQIVDVIVNQGNHSRTNDIWMAELIRCVYGHSGRVNVLNNDGVFIPYRMGKTFVLCHHSDKCKPKDLIHVMATEYAEDWGESEFRYIDIGHIHHAMQLKEHPGVRLESWNNLAPNDKWHNEKGYRSRQCLTVVYRSKTYGDVGRRTLPIERVRDMMIAAYGPDRVYVPKKRPVFTV